MEALAVTDRGLRLRVLVQPRASRTEAAGVQGDALKVRLAAPPVDGEANEELVRFLAKTLGVRRAAVSLTSGLSSRRKTVEIQGVELSIAAERLGL